MKIVINDPKLGKSLQKEVSEEKIRSLIGLKIGETISGTIFEYQGYEFKISGGSDSDGVPMRPDVHGGIRKRLFVSKGPGFKPAKLKRKGIRKKKMIRGNIITEDIAQINLIITKWGKEPIFKVEKKPKEKKSKK
ncbi:MAG: 30S ribosomal protein S6e [Candidatus Helarchaeota archaeon]|nr:30S ribosomal protein S6e [Candidatus Helarchaeota archaeon]